MARIIAAFVAMCVLFGAGFRLASADETDVQLDARVRLEQAEEHDHAAES
ncbi:MAG: hypothetical protein ACKVII_09580 [Planctomycetales bacterium]